MLRNGMEGMADLESQTDGALTKGHMVTGRGCGRRGAVQFATRCFAVPSSQLEQRHAYLWRDPRARHEGQGVSGATRLSSCASEQKQTSSSDTAVLLARPHAPLMQTKPGGAGVTVQWRPGGRDV